MIQSVQQTVQSNTYGIYTVGVLQTETTFPTKSDAFAGGGRQGSTYYLLNGAPNLDNYFLLAAPFQNGDATQEFHVISNNFDTFVVVREDAETILRTIIKKDAVLP